MWTYLGIRLNEHQRTDFWINRLGLGSVWMWSHQPCLKLGNETYKKETFLKVKRWQKIWAVKTLVSCRGCWECCFLSVGKCQRIVCLSLRRSGPPLLDAMQPPWSQWNWAHMHACMHSFPYGQIIPAFWDLANHSDGGALVRTTQAWFLQK